jgi:adenosine/AMP kinase
MKETRISKTDDLARQIADRGHIPKVRYSGSDYFCESQQSRCTKEDGNDRESETTLDSNEQDRFFGHFNMFF